MDLIPLIATERRRIADLIESLSPEQLATQSLCGDWTVKEVAGHVLAAIAAPRSWFLSALVRGGLRPHRANALVARRMAGLPADELAARLRARAEHPFRPPVVGHLGQLTDVQVHGQDIRRPLGLPHGLSPQAVRLSLDFLVGGRAPGFVRRGQLTGLRFEATDLGWAWGTGRTVSGPAEAVLLALTGRPVVLPELTGDGVEVLRDRLAR